MFEQKPEPSPYYHKPPMHFNNYEIYFNKDTSLSEVAPNKHSYYEFYFLLSGDVTFYVEEKKYSLISGDIVLISPNQGHHATIDNANGTPYERYVLWLDSNYMNTLSSKHTNLTSIFQTSYITNSQIQLTKDLQSLVQELFENIFINSNSHRYGADLLANAYIIELLVNLAQSKLFYPDSELDSIIPSELAVNDSIITNVLKYINEHIHERIQVSEICKYIFVSRSYLSKTFTEVVGIPIYQYIIKKKLFLAKQDLADGLEIQKISEKYNFGNYSSFYKAFRIEFGQSPKAYRDSLSQNRNTKF